MMEIFYISLLTVAASTVGTITGFGTSTIMIPMLVMFLPAVEAIFLVAIIHWFGNIWKITLFRKGIDLRLISLFGIAGLVTSYLGASITLGAHENELLRVLGLFLAGYSLFLLFRSRFRVPASPVTALSGGALSGFFAGMFGIGGAIRALFLSAFDLPKAVYIATAGAIGLLVDAMRVVTYLKGGISLPRELWWGMLIFIPVSFGGAKIAKKVVEKVPQEKFRKVIAAFLFVIGLKLVFAP
jgi:uncharacterized protein